ncbi:MAG TPA: phosphate-starvation-inducible PsiE family protein [Methanocorpusculum sp.]|nr:phosphate-starvation-inducible PsiE family protein [Methanocorpusculum sp.]HJK80905.1 phosphate-starvation-inducible PsiE family protein [Methanocorpusculum sp.]
MIQDFEPFPRVRQALAQGCGAVTIAIYVLIAILLVVVALMGVAETMTLVMTALENPTQHGLSNVLQAILLIIVIATLVDMVASYVRAGRVLVRPILIAGITTMVRRLLVSDLTFIDIIGTTIVILGLTVAMVYVGRDEMEMMEHLKDMKRSEDQ